ncbi:hypothetical protein J2I47_12755 [Fibrella sp. HMF5335]|uniref:Uncharacterized protein n=1 Tax=Fibrella rubiginis TaxID=2817060 RepID=A0A939K565_9BACT|nr:hypothetical protein [Fibrella rubiginis]MBO0937418.1 hypothetical protein [Fibrella rubiginis]
MSPFPITLLTGTSIWLHQIDLATYARLAEEKDMTFFCQNLTNEYAARGERLIHLWDDVIGQKPAVVASRLQALQGQSVRVPGRLTQARRIDKATATAFLETNHLQVPLPGKIRYGLFLPERYYRVLPPAGLPDTYRADLPAGEVLLAVATFAQPRQMTRQQPPRRSAELLRMANRLGCTVVGGVDKLLKTYLVNHPADDMMTYADRDWSDGNSYRKLGFAAVDDTPPQQCWIHPDEGVRYTRHTLPPGVTEANARSLGYVPIFNAGSRKFVR